MSAGAYATHVIREGLAPWDRRPASCVVCGLAGALCADSPRCSGVYGWHYGYGRLPKAYKARKSGRR